MIAPSFLMSGGEGPLQTAKEKRSVRYPLFRAGRAGLLWSRASRHGAGPAPRCWSRGGRMACTSGRNPGVCPRSQGPALWLCLGEVGKVGGSPKLFCFPKEPRSLFLSPTSPAGFSMWGDPVDGGSVLWIYWKVSPRAVTSTRSLADPGAGVVSADVPVAGRNHGLPFGTVEHGTGSPPWRRARTRGLRVSAGARSAPALRRRSVTWPLGVPVFPLTTWNVHLRGALRSSEKTFESRLGREGRKRRCACADGRGDAGEMISRQEIREVPKLRFYQKSNYLQAIQTEKEERQNKRKPQRNPSDCREKHSARSSQGTNDSVSVEEAR